ncbi:MAG TPA: CHAD domain-containing protein [Bacteroidales bacterium]|nr:CHAD domain-containing protein [Bacteroidales bacterium]
MEPEIIRIREIKPVLTEYISKSRELLKRSAVPDDDAVHDIRVFMKKTRAILRLTGTLMENDLYDRDLKSLKMVGQIMSKWRDTSVQRKTLRDLRKKYRHVFSKLESNEKITNLIRKPVKAEEPDEEKKAGVAEIDDLLNKTYFRIRFYQMQTINQSDLILNLEQSFENVRKIYLECRNQVMPEQVHEFRKRSKDLLYQLYFFRSLNPAVIKSVEKRLERMTMNLGKYNDLYQLLDAIGYVYPGQSNIPAMDELAIRIRDKQDLYLSKTWSDAYKCFLPGTKLADLLGITIFIIEKPQS